MKLALFALLTAALLLTPGPALAGTTFSGLEQSLGSSKIEVDNAGNLTIVVNWADLSKQLGTFFKNVISQMPTAIGGNGTSGGATAGTSGGTCTVGGGSSSSSTPGTPVKGTEVSGTKTSGAEGSDEYTGPGTVDVDSRLNIRDGKWGNVIGKLRADDKVQIIGKDGDWYKIKLGNGTEAYVHSRYVNKDGTVDKPQSGYVNTQQSGLNVRSAPNGPVIGQVDKGAAIKIVGTENGWTIIEYNGQRGYVDSSYVGAGNPPTGTVSGGDTPKDGGTRITDNPTPNPGDQNVDAKPVDGFTFPVGVPGCKFTDTWGAPRSGGRRHEGTDIFNKRNSPLVACKTGTIGKMNNTIGGRSIRVIADGISHYYTHLEKFGNVSTGQPINAGNVIGYMGNSGNAASTPVHLHFGMYRNGKAFNPYPTLHKSYRFGTH